MVPITVEDAAQILDALGSNGDPVVYRGVETTVNDLVYSEHAERDARKLRLRFYVVGRARRPRLVSGTLRTMILDRLGEPTRRRR